MADMTVTARQVRPLPGTIVRDYIAGGAGNVGDLVYINASGQALQAAGGAAGTAQVIGLVVSAGNLGGTAFILSDVVSVALWGPVTGFSAMTPGTKLYLSNTAGKLADAAGAVTNALAVALTATDVLLKPAVI